MTAERSLGSLLASAGIVPVAPFPAATAVRGVSIDSRTVRPGEVFFALRGEREQGARFASEALRRGAVAVVADVGVPAAELEPAWVRVPDARLAMGLIAREWFGRPDTSLTLVGITGTKGKTTVTYIVESIAAAAGLNTGRIGTVGYAFAGRESAATRTTPEATDLYALLAAMRDAAVSLVAMEVSSHALALHRVAGARFPVAAFLNLGRDHLEFHGGREAYFEAKASLFTRLTRDDTAVLPADDPLGGALAERTAGRIVRFGRSEAAEVRIVAERSGLAGSTVTLRTPSGALEVATPLPGRYNVDNAAAAAGCAVALGLPLASIRTGIEAVRSVPGRLEPVDRGQPFAVLVDYAHTEESLAAVLDAVRPLTPGRLAVAFGCGGDRDRAKRPGMGRAAAERADFVFLTSDNPRSEDAAAILREIEAGVATVPGASGRTRVIEDRRAAIAEAIAWARAGDAIVIAGKGHETTQVFADRTIPFDDRRVASACLADLGFDGGPRAGA
jgi:UDP-N-acetylmuramoyl-L-alanyl-D-glutamate--2,6-diaminopimelate ligase